MDVAPGLTLPPHAFHEAGNCLVEDGVGVCAALTPGRAPRPLSATAASA